MKKDDLNKIIDKNFGTKDKPLEDKITHTALSLLALDNHETDLAPLYDTIGRDNFLKVTKLYTEKNVRIPEYKLIRQNEYLIAAYYLKNKRGYTWPEIKDILDITKFGGFDNPAQFFSSISFAKRINNYDHIELTTACSDIMQLNISDAEWKEFFKR